MFCPSCNALLQEKDLLKSNVKKWENADIEYDARCPACTEEIGRMSWGKLTVHPDLLKKQAQRAQQQREAEAPGRAAPVAPKIQGDTGVGGSTGHAQATHPYCPHCGGQLPDDLAQLPRK